MSFLDKVFSRRSYQTAFGKANVVVMPDSQGERVRILELNGTFQSASYEGDAWSELPFAYFKGFDAVFSATGEGFQIEDILMMGGGGFAWPKHVLRTRLDVRMDVVEVDPEIIRIARKHLFLDRLERLLASEGRSEDLHIVVEDAASFLKDSGRKYDVIVNDLFCGTDVSESSQGYEFLADVKARLAPGGIYMQNVIADLAREGAYALFSLMSELDDAFKHVSVLDATDEEYGGADNYIVFASDEPHAIEGAKPFSM